MKPVDVIKAAANVVTGLGVGKTVDLLLKNNLPVEMNWKARVATFIGSSVLSGYISAKCSEYVEDEIDNVANIIDNVKNAVKLEQVKEVNVKIEATD